MESLEKIIGQTRSYIYAQKDVEIIGRYGCETTTTKLRKDRIISQNSGPSAFYITRYKVDDNYAGGMSHYAYRNSPLAKVLQQHSVGGDYSMFIPRSPYQASSTQIDGHIINEVNLTDNYIDIEGEPRRIFQSIDDFFEQLQKTKKDREENLRRQKELEEERQKAELEKRSAQEKKRITEAIKKVELANKKLEGQLEEQLNLTRYIHRQSQLRFRPVIDKIQSRIKFNDLYNGTTIVISGGPGTGKTTTMIARLKYLTDTIAITMDAEEGHNQYNLNAEQRKSLFEMINEDRDWVFFSPSQLLKEYLAKAMEGEQLSRPSTKTQNWKEFRNKMMREYGFFSLDNASSPFKRCRDESVLIYQDSHAVESLTAFYIKTICDMVRVFPDIKDSSYEWKPTALYISSKLSSIKVDTIDKLVETFLLLRTNALDESKRYEDKLKPYLSDIKERVLEIYGAITGNKEDLNTLRTLIKNVKEETVTEEDVIIDIDSEDRDESYEDSAVLTNEQQLVRLLEGVINPYSRSLVDEKKKLSERQQTIVSVLANYLTEEDKQKLLKIGEYYLLKEYTRYVYGPSRILLRNIPQLYKKYRKQVLDVKDKGWNHEALTKLLANGNKELHIQEQALLLGFVNNLIRSIKKQNKNITFNNKYLECYNNYSRPIIGIDEATDFSEVEIYAMLSFAHTDFSSVTIAGDVMQRMTDRGLHSWNDLKNVVKDYRVEQLKVSYRQSKKMLDVAIRLYQDTLGTKANFKAHLKEEKVPEAIAITHEDEDVKIDWIEKRIQEIYKVYGNHLPSIAIFLNNKNDASRFASKLGDTDFFYDNAIAVVDCSQGQTIGNADQVRVFPIDSVKGMEFDVVFFHDIDETTLENDLVKRYLYVGVSRAAFFLGATFKSDCPELSKYFIFGKDWK